MSNSFRKTLAASLALVLTACSSGGSSASSSTAASTAAATASANGPITIALTSNLQTMDTSLTTDSSSFTLQSVCMSGLVQNDTDGVPYPDLATWDISDDGLTYTFHIDENANWSNGDPVTAQDFVFAWKRLANPDTASDYSFFLDTIHVVNAAEIAAGEKSYEELGVEATDDKTFVVHLSLPCGFILSVMSNSVFFPINEKFYNEMGDSYGQSIDTLVYNGAYLFTRWDEGSAYGFTKNPDYIHADEIENEELEFRIILETQTAMLEFEQGNIDVVTLTGEMVDMYRDTEGFHNRLEGSIMYLSPVMTDENLGNKDLRNAISYAIDREAICESVLKDGSQPATGIIGKNFAFLPDGTDYREASGTLCSYDPEKAKEYWAKAQEALGDNVTIELYYEDSDAHKAVAENIQMMLKSTLEGLEVTMNCKPKKTRVQDFLGHNYQIMLTRWGPDYQDPQTFLDMFITGADLNCGLYESAEYDALVLNGDKGEDASDAQKRMEDYMAAEKILVEEDVATIPIYQAGSALMVTPGVEGIIYGNGNGTYRHIHRAN